jgi:hypothetical protein
MGSHSGPLTLSPSLCSHLLSHSVLSQVFSTPIHGGAPIAKRVIILEEDLQISSDFFEFFVAITPLLDSDDTLLAASAWNDNGIQGMVKDNTALYRSDFFPGLGWMMPRYEQDHLSELVSQSGRLNPQTDLGRAEGEMAKGLLGRLAS